jgi:dynamin 1-like protein
VASLMQKIGKDAMADRRSVATPGPSTANRPDDSDVGATPLSSSSLNNYYNSNDNIDSDYDVNGGGIMNFIFRGGQHPKPAEKSQGPPSIVHLPQVPDSMRQTDVPPTERERVEMEIIKSLIESYFRIVRKNFIDMVPKTIMYFLVNHVRDAMQNELVSELYRDAEMGTLMQEAEDVAQRRQTCVEMRDLLGKALEIVNEVRDFNTFK